MKQLSFASTFLCFVFGHRLFFSLVASRTPIQLQPNANPNLRLKSPNFFNVPNSPNTYSTYAIPRRTSKRIFLIQPSPQQRQLTTPIPPSQSTPTEPTDALTRATDSTLSTYTTNPTDATQSIDSTRSTEPSHPIQPTDSTLRPTDPTPKKPNQLNRFNPLNSCNQQIHQIPYTPNSAEPLGAPNEPTNQPTSKLNTTSQTKPLN